MDVAHAVLFAKKIDILRITADYSSAKFEIKIFLEQAGKSTGGGNNILGVKTIGKEIYGDICYCGIFFVCCAMWRSNLYGEKGERRPCGDYCIVVALSPSHYLHGTLRTARKRMRDGWTECVAGSRDVASCTIFLCGKSDNRETTGTRFIGLVCINSCVRIRHRNRMGKIYPKSS